MSGRLRFALLSRETFMLRFATSLSAFRILTALVLTFLFAVAFFSYSTSQSNSAHKKPASQDQREHHQDQPPA